MLLLTSFILTCIAAVLFLLRSLFVHQSDANPATGRDERTPAVRRRMRGHRVRKPAITLTLVHSNSTRQVDELLLTSHSLFQAKGSLSSMDCRKS
jgi:hypothetical protein